MNIWINLDITPSEYKKLVTHITKNMFFGVKRLAPNLRHMVFHSIGDAMFDDLQDIEHAEIYLQQKIQDDEISPEIIEEVLADDKWHISAVDNKNNKAFIFIVEKNTDLILFRKESAANDKKEKP